MPNLPAKTEEVDKLLERVIIGGDLSGMSAVDKTKHYIRVCHSMGLNPYTQPFSYLKLQGKELLYANKNCAEQLRQIRSISLEIVARELIDGIYTVRAKSSDPSGRRDEDEGSVPLPDSVKGELRSNMMMKATTKAKRRVTLSHCGLGFLDESEIDSIRDAQTAAAPTAEELSLAEEMRDEIPYQALHAEPSVPSSATGAAGDKETSPPASSAAALSLEDMAREAAMRGRDMLVEFYSARTAKEKTQLKKKFGEDLRELVKLYPTNQYGSNREGD